MIDSINGRTVVKDDVVKESSKIIFDTIGKYLITQEQLAEENGDSMPESYIVHNTITNETTIMTHKDICTMLNKEKITHVRFPPPIAKPSVPFSGRTIGNYIISNMCMETYPCQHNYMDIRTGVVSSGSGPSIYQMLKDDGHSDSHFNGYAPKIPTMKPDTSVMRDAAAKALKDAAIALKPIPMISDTASDVSSTVSSDSDDDMPPIPINATLQNMLNKNVPLNDPNTFYIDIYEISKECVKTDSSKHKVNNTDTGTWTLMDKQDIYEMLDIKGLSHPYFDKYAPDYESYIVGNYKISHMCIESDPCQHDITDLRTGVEERLDGRTIFKLLKMDGQSDPHFKEYVEEKKPANIDIKKCIVIGHFKISREPEIIIIKNHVVTNLKNQDECTLSSDKIYQLLKDNNYSDPRFPSTV